MSTESRFGDLVIDSAGHRVLFRGREIVLTLREFEILQTLVSNPKWVCTPQQLTSDEASVYSSADAVGVHITHLRRKLESTGCPYLVENVRGVGYRLSLPNDACSFAATTATAPPDTFVGRTQELGVLDSALAAAIGGERHAAFVTGEAGGGKTRLAEEVASHAEQQEVLALWGRSQAGDMPPYWPWIQILRCAAAECEADGRLRHVLAHRAGVVSQIVPEIASYAQHTVDAAGLTPEQSRFMLFDNVTRLLVEMSQRRPLLLILDDLHAAPEPSLLLLRFFLGGFDTSKIMLLGLYRNEATGSSEILTRVLGEVMTNRWCTCMTLEGLSTTEVGALLEDRFGSPMSGELVHAVHEQTGGNPFFVSEIVRMIASTGDVEHFDPGRLTALAPTLNVREVVRSRLDRLTTAARDAVESAAVIGDSFSVDLLEHTSGVGCDQLLDCLEEALQAGFLCERRTVGEYEFSHALVQHVLYRDLAPARRVRLHGKLAQVLEDHSVPGDPVATARIADHYYRAAPAGFGRKAVEYALLAAGHAMGQSAFEDAVDQCHRAIALLPEVQFDPDDRRAFTVRLYEMLGNALLSAGSAPEAADAYGVALAGCLEGDRVGRGRLHARLALVAMQERRFPDALHAFEVAEEALGDAPLAEADESDERWRVWIEAEPKRLLLLYFMGLGEEFDRRVAEHRKEFEAHADQLHEAEYTNWLVLRELWRERHLPSDATVCLARQHYDRFRLAGLRAHLNAAQLLGSVLTFAKQFTEAEEHLLEAARLAEEAGDFGTKLIALANLTTVMRMMGDVARTREESERFLKFARSLGVMNDMTATAIGNLAWVALREGDLAAAKRHGTETVRLMNQFNPGFPGRWIGGWPIIAVAVAEGDVPRALEYARDLLDPSQQPMPDDVQEAITVALSAEQDEAQGEPLQLLADALEVARTYNYV